MIWAGSCFAIVLFIGLAAALIPNTSGDAASGVITDSSALAPFHMAAMALAVISLLIRSYGFSDHRLKKQVGDSLSRNPIDPGCAKLSEPERRLWLLFRAIMPIQIIGWTVNELVVFLGLAATWSSGRFDAIYPFAFMALVLHVLMFPRFAPFAKRVESLGLVPGPAGHD